MPPPARRIILWLGALLTVLTLHYLLHRSSPRNLPHHQAPHPADDGAHYPDDDGIRPRDAARNPLDMMPQAGMSTEEEVHWLIEQHPVLVFSKTYCPWSTLAKDILNTYSTMSPAYHVIEVDLRPDMADIKRVLGRKTGRFTFPNVFIRGVSVGGGTNIQGLQEDDQLKKLLQDAGVLG